MTFTELLELDRQAKQKPEGLPTSDAAQPHSPPPTRQTPEPSAKGPRKTPPNRDTTTPRHRGIVTRSLVKRLRKAVKVVGKEAATHRFSQGEKHGLADIVYTYGRQGHRTSENEVVRIGVNWLIDDYQQHGGQSVLHKVLKALEA